MKKLFFISLSLFLIGGCASGISNKQKMDLLTYESRGLAVEEKSPGAAAALGILPGGGSFYGREYALGVVNLLFWPISICWDPVSGHRAALRINYIETMEKVHRLKENEITSLNQKMSNGLIDDYNYNMELARISRKYDIDPVALPTAYNRSYHQPANQNNTSQTNKNQQLRELQNQNLPYAEYQRRYQEIMGQ